MRAGTGCILTSCADFRALWPGCQRSGACSAQHQAALLGPPYLCQPYPTAPLTSLPPSLCSQAHRGDRHLWEPRAYQGGSHRFLHLHEQEGEADWQGRVQEYGQDRELPGTRVGTALRGALPFGGRGKAILQPGGEQERWAGAVWGTFLLSLGTNRRIAALFSTITWYKCQEC